VLEYFRKENIPEAPLNKDGKINMRIKQNKDAREYIYYVKKNAIMKQYGELVEQRKQEKIKEMCVARVDTSRREDCPICMEDMKGRVILDCCHVFCVKCSIEHFRKRNTCPLCRANVCELPTNKSVPDDLIGGIVNENLNEIYPDRFNQDMYNFILTSAILFRDDPKIDAFMFTRDIFEEVRKFGCDVGEGLKQWFED
jgi:hypothetical protein